MQSVPLPAPSGSGFASHQFDAAQVLANLRTSADTGLTSSEVEVRRKQSGANRLAEVERVPAWRRFLLQFNDLLIAILLAAAVVSFAVSRELKTPAVVIIVVLLNAVIGFIQENRAEASLDALRRMLVTSTRVRRDGEVRSVPSEELVVGDIVLVEAGDRVPADGRLLAAIQLEVEEAALTGESQPTEKFTTPIERADVGIGDRRNCVFMNTTVTRGRGEYAVTAIAMDTEIGRIAGLLRSTEFEKTPLQKQLDGLAHSLAKLAGVIVGLVFVIGLVRGNSFEELFITAVALAVASIPEGLPAVTAVTLAIGVSKMAKQHAIVKRLASVETLGCTSVICSDKTGTLTLNQMTATTLVFAGRAHPVTGTGYSPEGTIEDDRDLPFALDAALMPMALCSDAVVRPAEDNSWELIGDPTEGALVTLAAKGGLDVDLLRRSNPRIAEVPFDSSAKFMMTAHEVADDEGRSVVRLFVKGAPDVLMNRSLWTISTDGTRAPLAEHRRVLEGHNDALADQGQRVLAVAQRQYELEEWSELVASSIDLAELVNDLTFLALIGILDPPRPEARQAIAEARSAGITVKMITGDHAATATAIGRQLELVPAGKELIGVSGADLDRMDEAELDRRIDDIAVFARVAPEHKLRIVSALQRRSNVVAMTGDGVNDAPALKRADIGIAMGITGTEVTKEAATMVLTDDNFATIVRSVREGRGIYDNIVKFVRFQLSTTVGFALLFLIAAILGVADGKPFAAISILWVNIIMDGPPAMALGLDRPDKDIMNRRPRPVTEKILTRSRWYAVAFSSSIMAVGTLCILAFGPGDNPQAGVATTAGTMAFNTFVVFQFFNILNVRNDRLTVFRRETLTNRHLWVALVCVLGLQVAVTHVGFMQNLFDTTSISLQQWLVCVGIGSTVLWAEEGRKIIARRNSRISSSAGPGIRSTEVTTPVR